MALGEDGAASAFVASRFGLERAVVEEVMESAAVRGKMEDDINAFARYGLTVRPSFVMENEIGDWTILNGGHRESLLLQAIASLLSDATGYDWYAKHIDAAAP